MTQQRPTPVPQHRGELSDSLIALAGTPDDDSGIRNQLISIAQLSAQRVMAVSYASITVRHDDAYATVAASDDIALAVDEAQYADQEGPCLDALQTGRPLSVPHIAATMRWPGFRDTAYRLGLHTSLSIPLFAGRGETIAALNFYGRDSTAMAALTAAVWSAYDDAAPIGADHRDLDPGGAELIAGLIEAFALRMVIQQAIGIIMAEQGETSDGAYATLRLRAAEAGRSLPDTATMITRGSPH